MVAASPVPPCEDPRITDVVNGLIETGWHVHENFLSAAEVAALAAETRALWAEEDAFRQAGVGVGPTLKVRPEIRSDYVLWLDPAAPTPAQLPYVALLEQLRFAINQALFLGLFEFEGFLAVYPPGSFYQKHLDNFLGARHRLVTCVLYLNPAWQPGDGGELRLYPDENLPAQFVDIAPRGGTLACFLSERFPHEVLPARQERFSLTGWFRLRATDIL